MRLPGMIAVLLMSSIGAAEASSLPSSDITQQRQAFESARQALDAGQTGQFERLKAGLKNYPLYPYLELWQAQKELERQQDRLIEPMLEKHAGIPEAIDLRVAWIRNLAERGQWPHVAKQLAMLPGVAEKFPEIAMVTLWRTGMKDEAIAQFSQRWQQGYSSSDIAVPLEQAWARLGHPTEEERRGRIMVLAGQGDWPQISKLAEELPESDLLWVQQWQSMQDDPGAAFANWPKSLPDPVQRAMLGDAMHRLARQDVRLAWQALHRYHKLFDAGQLSGLEQRIALKAARQHVPEAAVWLASLSRGSQTAETRAWRVRMYLLQQDNRHALKAIRAMPGEEQQQSRWKYWKARTMAKLGQMTGARRLYEELAKGRGYYSFLSAEYLKHPYQFAASTFDASDAMCDEVSQTPAMQRAYEWWVLGDADRANREWYLAMRGASSDAWKAAARLAMDWGWYDRMIYAAYRAGESDALVYRFPKGFESVVQQLSGQTGLARSLIWSVIRQESAFNRHAVSRTGARGLMQLMPGTARAVAKKNDLTVQPEDLFDAETNIRLGSLYLSMLNERFDGNVALMAAAYNAGPTRVTNWLERTPFEHREAWIEAIPYAETRRYVQQVMAFMVVYDWLQDTGPEATGNTVATIPNKDVVTLN
ncbi:MAG TPA: transglycosylase SLT domain-containing protein [Mariprofundaceae bacterium]|nr:transglycosylase SLT domain-containing protein [Mariprofundaceae bacterium]